MEYLVLKSIFIFCVLFSCNPTSSLDPPSKLITNVNIIDGTGKASFHGSVRIREQIITELGDIQAIPGDIIIDGKNKYLAPGFIDIHSHHDWTSERQIEAASSQGITTIVVGQDGGSHLPLSSFFDSLKLKPLSVNIASYAGHNSIRFEVMGQDYKRKASETEVLNMQEIVKREMEAGALGLSTGLEYDPGIYSSTDEVIALTKVIAPYGGRYISHMRSEDRNLELAIEEIIQIGAQSGVPVQISHMKLARKSLWGKANEILNRLDIARMNGVDITADVYPYEYWQSTMTVLFPERDFKNRESASYALNELTSSEGMIITKFEADTSLVGMTLAQIAELKSIDPIDCYLLLIEMSQKTPGESVVAKSMDDADIRDLYLWEHTNVCSDGSSTGGHPRGWGSFPRFINKLHRENNSLTIEKAIYKMSLLAANHMGFKNMGSILPGNYADLVLFDPKLISDNASISTPNAPSSGILSVWVNGDLVYTNQEMTGNLPGRTILRTKT